MLRLSRFFAALLLTSVIMSFLSAQYMRIALPDRSISKAYFSAPAEEFVLMKRNNEETTYHTLDGRELSQREFRTKLPLLFYRDLLKWNIFPKEINGEPLSLEKVQINRQFLRVIPSDWNSLPQPLGILLESRPEGANLELPDDLFRAGERIEFIRPSDGSIDREKSARFNKALIDAGFTFPVQAMGGNPDTRKSFDEGYFMVDDRGALFQMQMRHGLPRCINTGQVIEEPVRTVSISESLRREFYGYIVTDTQFLLIMHDGYRLLPLPVENFNADFTSVGIMADILNTVVTSSDVRPGYDESVSIALDRDYRPVDTLRLSPPEDEAEAMLRVRGIRSFLFPWRLGLSYPGSGKAHLRIVPPFSPEAAAGGIILALACFTLLWRIRKVRIYPEDYAIIAVSGLSGILTLMLLDWKKR